MQKDTFTRCTDFSKAYRIGNAGAKDRHMGSAVLPHGVCDLLSESGSVHHTQEYTADLKLRIYAFLDILNRDKQLRHILRRQILGLDGNDDIIRCSQCVEIVRPAKAIGTIP